MSREKRTLCFCGNKGWKWVTSDLVCKRCYDLDKRRMLEQKIYGENRKMNRKNPTNIRRMLHYWDFGIIRGIKLNL